MDISNLTFIGLMSVGFVNVITFYKPELDSKVKIGLAFLFAFAATFVPAEIANDILNRAKLAIEVALASSGAYKIATKAGGQ